MKVDIANSAEAAVKTLSPDDRRRAFAWFSTLENWENDEFTRKKAHKLVGTDATLHALRSSSDFRIIFRLEETRITILDIIMRDTLEDFERLKSKSIKPEATNHNSGDQA